MGIRFLCDHCLKRLNVKAKQAGTFCVCPDCESEIQVPLESTVEPLTRKKRSNQKRSNKKRSNKKHSKVPAGVEVELSPVVGEPASVELKTDGVATLGFEDSAAVERVSVSQVQTDMLQSIDEAQGTVVEPPVVNSKLSSVEAVETIGNDEQPRENVKQRPEADEVSRDPVRMMESPEITTGEAQTLQATGLFVAPKFGAKIPASQPPAVGAKVPLEKGGEIEKVEIEKVEIGKSTGASIARQQTSDPSSVLDDLGFQDSNADESAESESESFLLAKPVAKIGADPLQAAPNLVWYVRHKRLGEKGPLKAQQVESMLESGQLRAGYIVWREDWNDWVPIDEVFPQLAERQERGINVSDSGRVQSTFRNQS